MKVVFLLDNNEYVEVAPDRLQVRQISDNAAALGTEVIVPLTNEDGTPALDENGVQKTQTGFRPFVNYAVNLLPAFDTPEAAIDYLKKLLEVKVAALAAPKDVAVVDAKPVADKKQKANGKAPQAKRKAN